MSIEKKLRVNSKKSKRLSFCKMSVNDIYYSDKYYDDVYEYRHVILPKDISKKDVNKNRLLSEPEWRALGIQMSVGWIHYHRHPPEPNILLFRREHHGNVPNQ